MSNNTLNDKNIDNIDVNLNDNTTIEWSNTFNMYVNAIEGKNIYDRRVLVKLDSGELIDYPLSWVSLINNHT